MSADSSLNKSASIVSILTALSSVLGFIRDILTASLFGAAAGFDAFLVAFKIPNFMRDLAADGAFSQALIPAMTRYRQNNNSDDYFQFISKAATWLMTILFIVTIVCEILAPLIVLILAPGFSHDPQRYYMALHMIRIMLPYVMLISLTAYCSAILNSYGHFAGPAFTPALLNIFLIAIVLLGANLFAMGEEALAWGVFLVGIVQLLFQLPFLSWYKVRLKLKWPFRDPPIKQVIKNIFPALWGVSFIQISLLIGTLFASFLPRGSISWLYYADRLTFLPMGIFGGALATVILPHLALLYLRNLPQEFTKTLDWALRLLLIVSIPAMLGLVVLSGPLTITLFKHGQFNYNDVLMTQRSIIAFAIGLPAFMAIKVLTAGFYSRHNLKWPVMITVIAILVNIGFDSILVTPLAHVGLALGTSFSAVVNAGLLFRQLSKADIYKPLTGWKKFLVQLFFANGMMSGLLLFGVPPMAAWLNWNVNHQIMNVILWLCAAILLYFSCLWVTGLRLKDLLHGGTSSASSTLIIE